MPEMAEPGEHHRDAVPIRRGDDFLIAYRTAGLRDAGHARLRRRFDAVREREERIGPERSAARLAPGALRGDANGVDAVRLPHADADGDVAVGKHDRIGLHVLDYQPGEL